MIGTGNLFKMPMWRNTSFLVMFTIMFGFGQCMVFISFLISTLIKTENQACNISYAIILSFLLTQVAFSNAPVILELFYNRRVRKNNTAMFVVGFLEYLPAYSYSMAFGLVAYVAGERFEFNSMSWISG